jgi:hypothetical protein
VIEDRLDDAGRRPATSRPCRDTIFSATDICNGAVGLCVVVGGLRQSRSPR